MIFRDNEISHKWRDKYKNKTNKKIRTDSHALTQCEL